MKIQPEVQYVDFYESDHGLRGLGVIRYRYMHNMSELEIYINFNKYNKDNQPDILLTGEKALNAFANISKTTDNKLLTESDIEIIGSMATGINYSQLRLKTRKREIVFARHLIMWGLNKYAGLTLSESGAQFNKDHATALHGNRKIDEITAYLTPEQRAMKTKFKRLIVRYANKKRHKNVAR